MTDPHDPSHTDADDVERHLCPRCAAEPGSPARVAPRSPARTTRAASRRCPGSRRSCGSRLRRRPPVDPDTPGSDIRIGDCKTFDRPGLARKVAEVVLLGSHPLCSVVTVLASHVEHVGGCLRGLATQGNGVSPHN